MYVSNISAQTLRLRYGYQSQQSAKLKDEQTTANSEETKTNESKQTEGSGSFADVLSIMSKDVTPKSDVEAFIQDSVSKVLEKIAKHASKVLSEQSDSYSLSVTSINITIQMDEGESLDDVQAELQDMLSDDGYWGVEKTSQRMFDFAAALAGDDPVALEKAKDAVTKGFKQAEALMGGQLPQISHDTYAATMDKFDSYIANINNSLQATYA